jgi:hypothetical protein
MDLVYIALTLAFFAASWGFVRLCAALEPPTAPPKEDGP